jgi:hypothetical protein
MAANITPKVKPTMRAVRRSSISPRYRFAYRCDVTKIPHWTFSFHALTRVLSADAFGPFGPLANMVIWHYRNGYMFAAPGDGNEFPLVMLLIYVAILFRGAGRCTLDRLIGKSSERQHPWVRPKGEPGQKLRLCHQLAAALVPSRERARHGWRADNVSDEQVDAIIRAASKLGPNPSRTKARYVRSARRRC